MICKLMELLGNYLAIAAPNPYCHNWRTLV
jgi:hypothetical protein